MRSRISVVLLLAVLTAPRLAAQATTTPAALYAEPGSRQVATIAKGVSVTEGAVKGEYVHVTVEGYVATSMLGGKRDTFPASVARSEVRLRASASTSAAVVATAAQGMGVDVVKRQGTWALVRRSGWMRRAAIAPAKAPEKPATKGSASAAAAGAKPAQKSAATEAKPSQKPVAAAPGAAPAPAGPAPSGVPAPAAQAIPENTDALTPRASAALSPAPGVAAVATIAHGAVLTPIARERGWVRVQLEGWMREDDLTAADSSIARLSAADLRANPDAYAGHLVRWAVQVLAFQTADEMRRDLKLNEPYLLAKGPGDEGALLYLTLPPALVDNAKALTPMTNVIVVARVRTGRGDPSGVPILDVLALTRR